MKAVELIIRFLAQDGESGIEDAGGEFIGAAGQMISAVLQTAGLYTQSEVLEHFTEALVTAGSLMYMVAVVGAIGSVAIFGNYKAGAYLLVGPALFYFMLTNTVTGDVTAFRFGNRTAENTKKDQLSFLNSFVNEGFYKDKATVSWFFAKFDKVVSNVVQGIVTVLLDTENNEDLLNVGRERMFTRLLMVRSESQEYLRLVSVGVIGKCGKFHGLNAELGKPQYSNLPPADEADAEEAQRIAKRDELRAEVQRLSELRNIEVDHDLQEYIEALDVEDLPEFDATTTCGNIWRWVAAASLFEAKQALEDTSDGGDENMPWAEIKRQVEQTIAYRKAENEGDMSAAQREAAAAEVIAAYLLRNTLSYTTHGALTSQIASRAPWNAADYNGIFDEVAEGDSYGGYLKIVYFAGAVPYIQGLLLYFLTASFPFFTVFLLMPGRAMSFLVWMTLWVWVKSWDVGFALVHVLRNLLWDYMAVGVNRNSTDIDWTKPESVYAVIGQNDPLYNFNTYTTLIGIVTLGVPMITAHFCLGANNLFNAFKTSIDGTANRFGQTESLAGRRRFANRAEEAVKREPGQYALAQVKAAMAKDGNTGGMTDNGVYRMMSGSGAAARHYKGIYNRAMYDYQMNNPQQRERWKRLAMFTGRRQVAAATSLGRQYIGAMVNTHNEQYEVGSMFEEKPVGYLGANHGHSAASNSSTDLRNPGSDAFALGSQEDMGNVKTMDGVDGPDAD